MDDGCFELNGAPTVVAGSDGLVVGGDVVEEDGKLPMNIFS